MVASSARRLASIWGWRTLILCAVPALIFGLAAYLQKINGPFYLCSNSDPDYVYLYSSLNLATGVAPGHTDHPGTTLQIWGAVVLRVVHMFAGQGNLADDVVAHAEFYLRQISFSLMTVYAVSLFFLGWVARRVFDSWGFALLAQSMGLVFPTILACVPRVNSESASLIASVWLGTAWLSLAYGSPGSRTGWKAPMGFGAVAATAMVTKLTFAPVLLLGVLLFETWRQRAQFLAAAAGFFVLLTLPIASHWGEAARWVWGLAAHRGKYGNGPTALPTAGPLATWTLDFFNAYPVYFLMLLAVAGVMALRWLEGRKELMEQSPPGRARALLAMLAFHIAMMLMVSLHPDDRYMVPSFGLIGLTGLVAVDLLRREKLVALPLLVQRAGWVMAAAFFAWQLFFAMPQFCQKQQTTKEHEFQVAHIVEVLSGKYLVVRCTWSSSPAYAGYLGNVYAGNRYAVQLARLYPGFVGLDMGANKYVTFGQVLADADPASIEHLLHGRVGVVFQVGLPVYFHYFSVALPPGYWLYPLYGAPGETIYWCGQEGESGELTQAAKQIRTILADEGEGRFP